MTLSSRWIAQEGDVLISFPGEKMSGAGDDEGMVCGYHVCSNDAFPPRLGASPLVCMCPSAHLAKTLDCTPIVSGEGIERFYHPVRIYGGGGGVRVQSGIWPTRIGIVHTAAPAHLRLTSPRWETKGGVRCRILAHIQKCSGILARLCVGVVSMCCVTRPPINTLRLRRGNDGDYPCGWGRC